MRKETGKGMGRGVGGGGGTGSAAAPDGRSQRGVAVAAPRSPAAPPDGCDPAAPRPPWRRLRRRHLPGPLPAPGPRSPSVPPPHSPFPPRDPPPLTLLSAPRAAAAQLRAPLPLRGAPPALLPLKGAAPRAALLPLKGAALRCAANALLVGRGGTPEGRSRTCSCRPRVAHFILFNFPLYGRYVGRDPSGQETNPKPL